MISKQTKKPDIIIVDDNLTFLKCLTFLINIDNVATVIGKASNDKEFIDLLSHMKPDLVLMDINMLQASGMEATQMALEMIPDLKIIAFTMFGDEEYYYKMNNLGIKGFILKSAGINELEKAIRNVMKGENYLSDELLKKFIINFGRRTTDKSIENAGLTARETKVMHYICQGLTNEEIAQRLSVGLIAVNDYKLNLLEKIRGQYTTPIAPLNSVLSLN